MAEAVRTFSARPRRGTRKAVITRDIGVTRGVIARVIQVALIAIFISCFFLDTLLYAAKGIGFLTTLWPEARKAFCQSFNLPPPAEIPLETWNSYIFWAPEFAWVVLLGSILLLAIALWGIPRWCVRSLTVLGMQKTKSRMDAKGGKSFSHLPPGLRAIIFSLIYAMVSLSIWRLSSILLPEYPIQSICIVLVLAIIPLCASLPKLTEIARSLSLRIRIKVAPTMQNSRVKTFGTGLAGIGIFGGISWGLFNLEFAFPLVMVTWAILVAIYLTSFAPGRGYKAKPLNVSSSRLRKWRASFLGIVLFFGIFLVTYNCFPKHPLGALVASVTGLILYKPSQTRVVLVKLLNFTKRVFLGVAAFFRYLNIMIEKHPRPFKIVQKIGSSIFRFGCILSLFLFVIWIAGDVVSSASLLTCAGVAIGLVATAIILRLMPFLIKHFPMDFRNEQCSKITSTADYNKYPHFVDYPAKEKKESAEPSLTPSRKHSRKTVIKTAIMGFAILGLFAGQMIGSLPNWKFEGPLAKTSQVDCKFLQLNHATLISDEDGMFEFNAYNQTLMICIIKDAELVNFSIGDGETLPQPFFATEGLNWWAMNWGKEIGQYNVTFAVDDLPYIDSFAVQPVFLAEGKVDFLPGETRTTQIPFEGLADISILIWTFMNYDDLIVNVDGVPLKEVNIGFDVRTTAMVALQAGTALRFNTWISAGSHTLEIGGGNFSYCVVSQYDTDGDQIDDATEMEHFYDKGTYPDYPDIWGIQYDVTENVTGVFDENSLQSDGGEFWQRHSFDFYIPGAYAETTNFLFIEVYDGIFKQFEIDGDGGIAVGNITLIGSTTASNEMKTVKDVSGHEYTGEAWQFPQQDSYCAGMLEPGWHEINYLSKAQLYSTEDIRFRINDNAIIPWDSQTLSASEIDSDGDSVPDDAPDISPGNYLDWCFPQIQQLVIPVDESGAEDVEVIFQVLRPDNEKNINEPFIWHKGEEGELKCRLIPAMRLFGCGNSSDPEYWYKHETFASFWGENGVPRSIQTYNLVQFDALGNYYNPNMNLELIPGSDPYAYYTFLNPSISGKLYEYSAIFAHDFPALTDGALSIFYDFCYLVVNENWDNESTSVLHVYDYETTESLRISGINMKTYSAVNGMATSPTCEVDKRALWMLNMNPSMDDGVNFEWDQELRDAHLTQFTNGHLFASWQYDAQDPATWSASERLERGSLDKSYKSYAKNYDFLSGLIETEPDWGSSGEFVYVNDYYGMTKALRMDVQPNKVTSAFCSFDNSFTSSSTGSVSFDMIWSMDQYAYENGQLWFGLGRQGEDIATIRIYQGAIWYGDEYIHSIAPRIWFRVDFKYNLVNRQVDLYINGVLQKANLPFLGRGIPDELLIHGAGAGPTNQYPLATVTGCIDNVRFAWNYATFSPKWAGKNYVEYLTMTQGIMDPLSKLLLGVKYDQETHQEFINYAGTWDFAGSLPASGWNVMAPEAGSASIIPYMNTHTNVVELESRFDTEWFGISHSVEEPRDSGEVGFYFSLDPVTCPSLRISLGEGTSSAAIVLLIQNGKLIYQDPIRGLINVADLWYGTFFSLNIVFDCKVGTYDVFLSTPGYCTNKSLPFITHLPVIDSLMFEVLNGKAFIDAVWCNWTGDLSGQYLPYSFIKSGDARSRVSITSVKNVYNGTVDPDGIELRSENMLLWESSWSDEICEHEEVSVGYIPEKVNLDRAGSSSRYQVHDRLKITYASGLVSPVELPSLMNLVDIPMQVHFAEELTLETSNEWTGEGSLGLPPAIAFNDVNGDLRKLKFEYSASPAALNTLDSLTSLYSINIVAAGVVAGLLRVGFYVPTASELAGGGIRSAFQPRTAPVNLPFPVDKVKPIVLSQNLQKLIENFADFSGARGVTEHLISQIKSWELANLPSGFQTTLYKEGLGEWYTDIRSNTRVLLQLGELGPDGKYWIPDVVTRSLMNGNRDQLLLGLTNYERYCNFLSPDWLKGVDDPFVTLCYAALPKIDPVSQSVLGFQGKSIIDMDGNVRLLSGTWDQMRPLLLTATQQSLDDLVPFGGFILEESWDYALPRTFMVNVLSDARDPGTLNALFRSIYDHKANPFSVSTNRRMGGKAKPWSFRDPATGKLTTPTRITKSDYWKLIDNSPSVGSALPGLSNPLVSKDIIQEIPDLSGAHLDDLGLCAAQIVYGADNLNHQCLLELKLEISECETRLEAGTWVRPDGTFGTADDLRDLRLLARVWEDQVQYRNLPLSTSVEIWDDALQTTVEVPRYEIYARVFGITNKEFPLGDLKGYGFTGTLFSLPNPGPLNPDAFQSNPKNWFPDNDIFYENHRAFVSIAKSAPGVEPRSAPRFFDKLYQPYYIAPQFKNTYHKGSQGFDRFKEIEKYKVSVGKSPSSIPGLFNSLATEEMSSDADDAFRMVVILSGIVGTREISPEEALFVYYELRSLLELYSGPNFLVEGSDAKFPAHKFFASTGNRLAEEGVPTNARWREAFGELMNHPDLTPRSPDGAIRWQEMTRLASQVYDDATMEKWFGRLGYHSGYPGGPEQFFKDHRADLPWAYRHTLIDDPEIAAMEEYLRPSLEAIDLSELDFYQRWLDVLGQEWMDYFYPAEGVKPKLTSYFLANVLPGEGPEGQIDSAFGHSYIHDFFAERLGVDKPNKFYIKQYKDAWKAQVDKLRIAGGAGRGMSGVDYDYVTDVKILQTWNQFCIDKYDQLHNLIYWQKKGVGNSFSKYSEFLEDPFGKVIDPETLAELEEVAKIYKMDVLEMISNIRTCETAKQGVMKMVSQASLWKPSIWDVVGNVIGIFIDILLDWGNMQEEVDALQAEHGWSNDAAWAYTIEIWNDKWLWEAAISTVVDLTIGGYLANLAGRYVFTYLMNNLWSETTATVGSSLTSIAVSMLIAMIIAMIVTLVWDYNRNEQLRYELEWKGDLNVKFQPEIEFPYTTQKSLYKHLSLTVGDSLEIQTTIENQGELFWEWDPPSILNGFVGDYRNKVDDVNLPSSGAPFWFSARYAFDQPDWSIPEAEWTSWVGQWNSGVNGDHTPPMVGYHYGIDPDGSVHNIPFEWDIYTCEGANALWHTPAQTYTSTFTLNKALPSVTWYVQQRVASTFQRRTDHGVNVAQTPVEGMRVLEGSLSDFLTRSVRIPIEEDTSAKLLMFQSMLEGYNWTQAVDLGQEILSELEAMTLGFSEEEYLQIANRVKDLRDIDAPAQYRRPSDNRFVAFSVDEKQAYGLLTFDSQAEFDKFFEFSYKGASTFADLGFRVPGPDWSQLASTTFSQDFNDQNYQEFPVGWIGNLAAPTVRIWAGDEIGAPATFYSYSGGGYTDSWSAGTTGYKYVSINGVNANGGWVGKDVGLTPKGVAEISMIGPCPIGYSTQDMAYTIGLGYWDGYTLTDIATYEIADTDKDGSGVVRYGDGWNSFEMIHMAQWNAFRIEWDYTAGSGGECGFLFQYTYNGEKGWCCPFGLSGYHRNEFLTDKIPNMFFIRMSPSGGLGWVCFDDVRITSKGSFFASNAFAYSGYSSTPPQLLVPKDWLARMTRCYDLIDDIHYILNHIPINAEIEAKSTWGSILEILPGNATVASLALDVRADFNVDPWVDWEITIPDGFDIHPLSGSCKLHSLTSITFSITPQITTPVGIYLFNFHVYLQDTDRTEIYAREFSLRYVNYRELSLGYNPVQESPYVWGKEVKFATLANNGNSPEWASLEIEGLPKDWFYSRGYYNTDTDLIKYYDFTASTQGFSSGVVTSTGLLLRSDIGGVVTSSSSGILDLHKGDQIQILYKWIGSPETYFRLMRSEMPVETLLLPTGTSSVSEWKQFTYTLPDDALFDKLDFVVNCDVDDLLLILWICIVRPVVLPVTTPVYKPTFSGDLSDNAWGITSSQEYYSWEAVFTVDWSFASGDAVAKEGDPRMNFGNEFQLHTTPASSGTQQIAFIQRPDLPYFTDGAQLMLKLWSTNGEQCRLLIYEVARFIESDLTWTHRPPFGGLIANVTLVPGENIIQLDSTGYAFALVAAEGSVGTCFISKEGGVYGPQFKWDHVPNLWQGDGALYIQADDLATYSLKSPVLPETSLTSDDWVYVRFTDNTASKVTLSLYWNGWEKATFIIAPAGEAIEKLHWRYFRIPNSILIDQIRITATLNTGEYVFVDEFSIEQPQVYTFIQANVGGFYNETVPLCATQCYSPLEAFTADGWILDATVVPTITKQVFLTKVDVVDSLNPTETPSWLREFLSVVWSTWSPAIPIFERRTYFTIPAAPLNLANPATSCFIYLVYAGPNAADYTIDNCYLNVAPAFRSFEEGQLCWNNQPGFDDRNIVWQLSPEEISDLAPENHIRDYIPVTGIVPSGTYCMYATHTGPLIATENLEVVGFGDESEYGYPLPYATYTWNKVTSANGSLVLQTDVTEKITISRLTDIVLPIGGLARTQIRGTLVNGASIKFYLEGGDTCVWDLSSYITPSPVECSFSLPSGCRILGIEVMGDLTSEGQVILDYLTIGEESDSQAFEEIEWGGHRDVLRIPEFGCAEYEFDSSKSNNYIEFWFGGHGNCTITLGNQLMPLGGITFGLINDRWWFVDGTEVKYINRLHKDSWEHIRVMWYCDSDGEDTFMLTFDNDTFGTITGRLITGSPDIDALDHIRFTGGSGKGWRLDALSCGWQNICGPLMPPEDEIRLPYAIGSNFADNVLQNASGQLAFLSPGHWREYYFRASESTYPNEGTYACFAKATNIYSHECVGKLNFTVTLPHFYSTSFRSADGNTELLSQEVGAIFTYDFILENLGNAPQEYTITTENLMPYATPVFSGPGIAEGSKIFDITLSAGCSITFSLTLANAEPCLCFFSVIASPVTCEAPIAIPASFLINMPPSITSAPDDLIYEQGSAGHALTWTIMDASPVPGRNNYYGIYTNSTMTAPDQFHDQYWATYTFDGAGGDLPDGWFGDQFVGYETRHAMATGGPNGGSLWVPGWFEDDQYYDAWVPFGDQLSGTVEWWNYPIYGIMEVGLFRDGVPIATVTGGNLDGWDMDTGVNGISMGKYYEYMSITFDATVHAFNITTMGWNHANIAFANDLVPNEFRVRIINHMTWQGVEHAGEGRIDNLGFSWDPHYCVGDNARVRLVQAGQFNPAGEVINYNVDGLLPDPIKGFADYKFALITTDMWLDTTTGKLQVPVCDLCNVRVLSPEPVILPISSDIFYEYGTVGHSLKWQIFDAAAPLPAYEVWRAGAELPGHYCGTETFDDTALGNVPANWFRDDPTDVGVVDECFGHSKCLQLQADNGIDSHSATLAFPVQSSGTIEWWMYWDSAGSFDVNFGSSEGMLASITASTWSGVIHIYTPTANWNGGGWYPIPDLNAWHRFKFAFNALAGDFSFTSYSYGCLGWNSWNGQPYGVGTQFTWTGNFGPQSSGVSYIQLVANPDIYGRPSHWTADSIGFSWDPLYEVGDLVHLDHEMLLVTSGTWTSGDIIEVPIDGLSVGTYDITFAAFDGNGYASGKHATVTIYNVAPEIVVEPDDLTFLVGTLAPSIEWTPIDASTLGASYHIIEDGAGEITTGSWASGVPITWNPSALPIGEHHIILQLDDGLGGTLQNEVIVKANDQVSFVGTPLDFSYYVGNPDFIVSWTVSDLLGVNPTYDLYVRQFDGQAGLGDLFCLGSWSSGTSTNILVNMGGMPTGMYLASMVVADGLGTQATDQVVFYVTPEGMSPLDWLESQLVGSGTGMTCGTRSGDVIVDVTLDTAEDTQVAIGIWNTPPQPAGPDFATDGVYFTVDAEKEAAVSFPIYVDVTLPGGFPVGMTESDVTAWLRFLYFDEVSDTWVDSNFPMVGIDMVTGTATFEVWHLSTFALGYANGLPPKIDGPGILEYEWNAPAPQLVTWRLADLTLGPHPSYAVFLDGGMIAQDLWAFGARVTVDVAGLPLGTHDLEIIAFDDLGGASSSCVAVEVCNMPPALDQPADVIYEVGTAGQSISWVPVDISVSSPTYIAVVDGIQVISGAWTSGAGITLPVDGLGTGVHVAEISIQDGLGGVASGQVMVVVTNTAPVVATQGTITYEAGDPRPVAEWVVTDPSVLDGTYVVYRDGTPVMSGHWVSGVPFTTGASGMAAGAHQYSCVVVDGFGGTGAAGIDVIVVPDDDTVAPSILALECAPVQDTAPSIPVKVLAFDGESGIDRVIVEYYGHSYPALLAGGYYTVDLPNPGIVGTMTAVVTAWDADQDYPGDAMSTTQTFSVTFINTVPQVATYFTNASLAGEYPGSYTFSGRDLVPFSAGWNAGVTPLPGQPVPGVLEDYCHILPEYAGHEGVLQLYKDTSVAQVLAACFVDHEIPAGSIELWLAVEGDASFMAALSSFTPGISGPWIVVTQGQLVFVGADGSVSILGEFSAGWHLLQIDFAGVGTSYSGLTENQVSITLDGTYSGALDAGAPLHVTGFAAAASQVGDAPAAAVGSFYLDAIDFSWSPDYVPGRNRNPGIFLPQAPTPEVTLISGEEGASLQWLPSDVSVRDGRYEISINGTRLTSGFWASRNWIIWDASTLGPGDYLVEMVLDDGYGGTATNAVILHVTKKFDAGPLLLGLDALITLIEQSANGDWTGPATQHKHAMVEKLNEVEALLLAGNFAEAYDKLLHDIKPKLTGLKVDENGVPWGDGVFNNPWVIGTALQETCQAKVDGILAGICALMVDGAGCSIGNPSPLVGETVSGVPSTSSNPPHIDGSLLPHGIFAFILFLGMVTYSRRLKSAGW